ncbi:sensor histidine kinase [Actinomadura rudentiformis]|uniref:Sensor histidine kinase n=1 Tax=Actinomadura rudentiformis TaxID=359158 RepID=A0A6H9YST9_9ACTN|nr:sensor histidine kinase [Actinomadura rudentiformis]KAB2346405.1 sensor histidine kinase [Actinomadura rudentiformis]
MTTKTGKPAGVLLAGVRAPGRPRASAHGSLSMSGPGGPAYAGARERGDRQVSGSRRRRPDIDLDKVDRKGPSAGALCIWMLFLAWPIKNVLGDGTGPLWLALPAIVAAGALYVAVVFTAFSGRVPLRLPFLLFGALMAVVGGATFGFGDGWYPLFPMLGLASGALAGHVRARENGPDLPLLVIIGLPTALSILVPWLADESGESVLGYAYGTATAALVTAIVLRLFIVIGMLREAREELAHAAVERERLRFSRDLHDLLGHTLSIMVVKAQAVRRIAEHDPKVAAEQAADIETVGRQALGEVRQAVHGYRGRGLAGELDAAHTALADAGIEPVVRREGPPPPPEPDALLGWAVREGITNVIRHSGARHCEISVHNDGYHAVLEIHDDGSGANTGHGHPTGSAGDGLSLDTGGYGLKGLKERMAAANGTVEAGPHPGGGYMLKVAIPVTGDP